MSGIRVYIPVDAGDLALLADTGTIDTAGRFGYAVTAPVLATLPEADRDEREYAAFLDAALAAAGAATRSASTPALRRRVIASADLPSGAVEETGAGTQVRLTGVLQLTAIAAFHVDASPGGASEDLLWYDVSELPEVLGLARGVDQ